MSSNNVEISEIADQACIKILADEKQIEIKHKLRMNDKSIWGVLLFLCGGIFFIVISIVKGSNVTSQILGVLIGLVFLSLSIMALVRQLADKVKVDARYITFRYNLKLNSVLIEDGQRIKMKTEKMRIRRAGTLGSDFIIVTHYLKTAEQEIPILKFQMDNSNADKAIRLGNELTQMMNGRFQKQREQKK